MICHRGAHDKTMVTALGYETICTLSINYYKSQYKPHVGMVDNIKPKSQ